VLLYVINLQPLVLRSATRIHTAAGVLAEMSRPL
jgi:hypothetical protein